MCMNCKAERGRCSEGQPPSALLCLRSERNVAVKYTSSFRLSLWKWRGVCAHHRRVRFSYRELEWGMERPQMFGPALFSDSIYTCQMWKESLVSRPWLCYGVSISHFDWPSRSLPRPEMQFFSLHRTGSARLGNRKADFHVGSINMVSFPRTIFEVLMMPVTFHSLNFVQFQTTTAYNTH